MTEFEVGQRVHSTIMDLDGVVTSIGEDKDGRRFYWVRFDEDEDWGGESRCAGEHLQAVKK